MLQSLMALRKNRRVHNFDRVVFWGKIITAGRSDYLIAQGFERAVPLYKRAYCKSFYSQDGGVTFKLLPDVDAYLAKKILAVNTMFTGDPSYVHVLLGGARVNEEQRLAAAIMMIDDACATAPRYALAMNHDHAIVKSSRYSGMSAEDAQNLSSFVHFRHVPGLEKVSALDRDFLHPLDKDEPQGTWVLGYDSLGRTVSLRNFMWPGFQFSLSLVTGLYTNVYMGDGVRNSDFPFMIYT
eukprot:tig00000037_g10104.t1